MWRCIGDSALAAVDLVSVRFGWIAHPFIRGLLANVVSLMIGAVFVPLLVLSGVHLNRGVFPYLLGALALAALLLAVSWGVTLRRRGMHYRCRQLADDVRSFLAGKKHLDPVYGPNSWQPDPAVAADPVREAAWRTNQRDRAFWEYQRDLAGEYEQQFSARVLLLLDDLPRDLASPLPRERFSRPSNDSEIKDVVEHLAVAAERLREGNPRAVDA
jgi:hypothetical protein